MTNGRARAEYHPVVSRAGWRTAGAVAGPPVAALLVGYAVIEQPSALTGVLGLVVLLLIGWRPVAVPVAVLLLCQEIDPRGDAEPSFSQTVGWQLYYGDQAMPPIVLLMVACAGVALLWMFLRRRTPVSVTPEAVGIFLCVLVLGVHAALLGLAAGADVLGAVNQEARPFLLMLCGVLVGATFRLLPHEPRSTERWAAVVVVALLVIAVWEIATGGAESLAGGSYFAFYDSAGPAAAAAVLLALVLRPRRPDGEASRWPTLVVGAAALIVVIVSFRRSVWVAAAVALAVALLVAYGRRRVIRRLLLGTLAVVPLALLVPGLAAAAGERFNETIFSLSADDASTRGHITDIEIAWGYVQHYPLTGLGPRHPNLPGLVADISGGIYVHNEWLHGWLRLGLLSVLLLTAVMVLAIGRAVAVLRGGATTGLVDRAAALFVLMVPVCCFTNPFLTASGRWPALFGLAAGILTVLPRPAPDPTTRTAPARDASMSSMN